MALTFEEEKELQNLKHKNKTDFENLRFKNRMDELRIELEISKNN